MREPKKVRTNAELAKSCRMLREHNERLKGRIVELEATIKAIRELPDKWRKYSFDNPEATGYIDSADCADELEARLEISPDHDVDGIEARDETIKLLDDRIEQLEGRLHDADLQGAKLEAALKAKTAEFDRLLRRDTDNLKRLIAAQATLQAIQELPRYAIETTFGGGWKAVPAEGYESTTFVDTDELEALLRENQHE